MPLDTRGTGKSGHGQKQQPQRRAGPRATPTPGRQTGATRVGDQKRDRVAPWQQKKLLFLVALIAVWGLIFGFRSVSQAPARPPAPGPVTRGPEKPVQGRQILRLKTDLLGLPAPTYTPESKTLFGTPPPPPPPPQPVVAVPQPAVPPPPLPDPFQVEAKALRYVGYLEAGQESMAFITQGPEIYTAEAGATILGRFRAQAITDDAVLLTSPSGDKQVRLPIVGTSPSAAPPPMASGGMRRGGLLEQPQQQSGGPQVMAEPRTSQ